MPGPAPEKYALTPLTNGLIYGILYMPTERMKGANNNDNLV